MKKFWSNITQGSGKDMLFRIIGVLIILIILYLVIKKIVGSIQKSDKEKSNQDFLDRNNSELNSDCNSSNTTYSQGEYENIANNLFQALDGCGSDGESVRTEFEKLQTRCDVLKVIDAYGTRETSCGWSTTEPMLLGETLADEGLSAGWGVWTDTLIVQVNEILELKNINYRF